MTTTHAVRPSTTASPVSSWVHVLRSEALKLRSVPSTFWTVLAVLVANIGVAALMSLLIPGNLTAEDRRTTDAVRLSVAGFHFSQVAMGVLGALVITSEYGTGSIRLTFAAIPQRRKVLAAKALVFTVVAVVIGMISSFAAFFSFQVLLTSDAPEFQQTLGDEGVFRALSGGGLFLAVMGLLGLGLGAVIRSSAGAISTLLGLIFVPPLLLELLPQSWQDGVGTYLPMQAGSQIFIAVHRDPNTLGPWQGFAVFSGYALAALLAGFWLVKRRDA